MVEAPAGESQARRHILEIQIRQLGDDLLRPEARRQEIEHVDDPDAQPPNAGAASALVGVHGDALHQLDRLAHATLLDRGGRT